MNDDKQFEFQVTYAEQVKWCHNFYQFVPNARTIWGTCPLQECGQNAHCWQCCFNNNLPYELAKAQKTAFGRTNALALARGRYNRGHISLGVAEGPYGAELYFQHVDTLLSPVAAMPMRIEKEGQ